MLNELTDYLTTLHVELRSLENYLDDECNASTPVAIVDSLTERIRHTKTQLRAIERQICTEKKSPTHYIAVPRTALESAIGETGVHQLETEFTQMMNLDGNPHVNVGDIIFVANEFEYERLRNRIPSEINCNGWCA